MFYNEMLYDERTAGEQNSYNDYPSITFSINAVETLEFIAAFSAGTSTFDVLFPLF